MPYSTELQQIIAYLKQGGKIKPPPAKPAIEPTQRPKQIGVPQMPVAPPPKM